MKKHSLIHRAETLAGNEAYLFDTTLGKFITVRHDRLDVNGNPRWTITPMHVSITSLPKLEGFRRNAHFHNEYTTQSYAIDDTVQYMLEQLTEMGMTV